MKPEEQMIALATWEGWESLVIDANPSAPIRGSDPRKRDKTPRPIPYYLNNRDAIVQLVKKFDSKQAARFIYHVEQELSRIRFPDLPAEMKEEEPEDWLVEMMTIHLSKAFQIATADPAVWTKAALKTLNLWTDD